MTRATDSTRTESRRTDLVFGFAAGLYAGTLVAPAVAIAVALRATTDAGALFVALLGTAAVVGGAVGWAGCRESFAVRLGATRWVWAVMALPFVYFGMLALLEAVPGTAPSEPVAGTAIVGALTGVITGTALAVAARNRHARAVLADAEEFAEFSAAAPERDRRMAKKAAVATFAVGLGGMLAGSITGVEPLRWAFQIVAPLGAGLFGQTTERNFRVTDAGLAVGNAVQTTVRPWSDFESYEATDEAIVVRRAGWSARGLRDVRCDSGDVDDPEAIATALGRFLPPE